MNNEMKEKQNNFNQKELELIKLNLMVFFYLIFF